ncbi:MAG: serine hydrolase [Pseudomonadota bacterium]
MSKLLSCIFLPAFLLLLAGCATHSASSFDAWDESPLSAEGIAGLEAFFEETGTSSYLLLYQGKVAYSYGDIHHTHLIHSMRKPLMSLLYGSAVESGQIDLDETLATLGLEEDGIAFTDNEKQATVAHLLQSRSAIYLPAAAETEQMSASRPERDSHVPGEHYYYNNWSFNSVGTLFEEKTGQGIYEAFNERLAEPLGMVDFKNRIGSISMADIDGDDLPIKGLDGFYYVEPEQSRHAAYHFRLSSHDLGLIGQMLANGGLWNGERLISQEWIDKSTDCYSVTNDNIGGGRSLCYGMMWEVTRSNGQMSSFSHTGLGTHMLLVHPGANLVMVHRVDSETDDNVRYGGMPHLIGLTFGAFQR